MTKYFINGNAFNTTLVTDSNGFGILFHDLDTLQAAQNADYSNVELGTADEWGYALDILSPADVDAIINDPVNTITII